LTRQGNEKNGNAPAWVAPVLPAFRIGDQLLIFCDACKRAHYHGAAGGSGHRAAHCSNPDSPYIASGYVLQEAVGRVLWVIA
jgi:hypothetical protein